MTPLEKNLSKLNLETQSITDLENVLSNNLISHTRPTINISFNGLFRARKITYTKDLELLKTNSIWYPDWLTIPESKYLYNRCSDKGQNFFYSSNHLEATIKELNLENLDIVLIGVFHQKYPNIKARSQFAGIETLRNSKNHKSILENYQYYTEIDRKTERVIASIFQEKISDNENYKYKLSIALSNILLKNSNIECLIYPSVASNLELVNYGIKSSFVDEHLYCSAIFQYSVQKSNSEYTLTPIKYGEIHHNLEEPKQSNICWKDFNGKDSEINIRKYSF